MLGQGLGRPGAEGVDYHVEAGQVGGREVKEVALDDVLGVGPVGLADHGGYLEAAAHGLLHDGAAGLAVGGDDGDFEILRVLHGMLLCVCGCALAGLPGRF